MTQKSFFWNGASVGDADAYTRGGGYHLANAAYESPFVDIMLRALFNGDGNRGVLRNIGNELAVAGVATPVTVDTGGALVYGMPYENTAVVNVAVMSPTSDTRQDRIVLRRDWTAQTVRVTHLAGAEGGGLPALVQSPAPDGSGVYDVPLAALSVTTGGAITVTDEREYCQFGTVPGPLSIGTVQIANNAVDWTDRETRTCRLFLGGGDLHPTTAAGQFTPGFGTGITWTGASGWDGGGNTQGWRLQGSRYEGVYATFTLPANMVPGDMTSYVWWTANAGVASSFSMRTAALMFNNEARWLWWHVGTDAYETINSTLVANNWYRSVGPVMELTSQLTGLGKPLYRAGDLTLFYVAYWDNATVGAEDINVLGIELVYTGYG